MRPGAYDVRTTLDGFKTTSVHVNVGASAPKPLRVTLPLAGVKQEITVSNFTEQVNTSAANNLDAVTIDQDMLGGLPMLDQNYIAMVSRFLDTGSLGTGGPTIVVNGMEVSSLNVTASAVQQIKINQDPYSAEYSRPGRGRIEILTKPGSQDYEGELNLIERAPQFNARNAFATTPSTEQRQIVDVARVAQHRREVDANAADTAVLANEHDSVGIRARRQPARVRDDVGQTLCLVRQ